MAYKPSVILFSASKSLQLFPVFIISLLFYDSFASIDSSYLGSWLITRSIKHLYLNLFKLISFFFLFSFSFSQQFGRNDTLHHFAGIHYIKCEQKISWYAMKGIYKYPNDLRGYMIHPFMQESYVSIWSTSRCHLLNKWNQQTKFKLWLRQYMFNYSLKEIFC